MKELNAAQVEAIEIADANLNNANLPMYSDLMKQRDELFYTLRKLANQCDGSNLGTVKAPTWATLCEVATLLHNTKP